MKYEFDFSEYIKKFDQETDERAMIRFAGYPKKYKNPREEKVYEFRRGYKTTHYDKENTWARKIWRKKARNTARQVLKNAKDLEEIDIVDIKKTSGWITH